MWVRLFFTFSFFVFPACFSDIMNTSVFGGFTSACGVFEGAVSVRLVYAVTGASDEAHRHISVLLALICINMSILDFKYAVLVLRGVVL